MYIMSLNYYRTDPFFMKMIFNKDKKYYNRMNIYNNLSIKRCGVIFIDVRCNSNFNKKDISLIVVRGKNSNIWSLPKGRVQNNKECEEDCAIREVYEETGIKIKSVKGLPRVVFGQNVYFVYHVNMDNIKEFQIHDNLEIGEVSWKNIEELKSMLCNKDIRALLKCYTFKKSQRHYYVFNKPCGSVQLPFGNIAIPLKT